MRKTFLNFNRTNSFYSNASSLSREDDIREITLDASPSKKMIDFEINTALDKTSSPNKTAVRKIKSNIGMMGVTMLENKLNDTKPLNVS